MRSVAATIAGMVSATVASSIHRATCLTSLDDEVGMNKFMGRLRIITEYRNGELVRESPLMPD